MKEFEKIIRELCKKHKIKILRERFKSPVGRAWHGLNEIKIPILVSVEHFMVALHEIGHIVSGSVEPPYLDEYNAEMYALKTAKLYKIENENYIENARAYVLHQLSMEHNKECYLKLSDIPDYIIEFVKPLEPNLKSWTGYEIKVSGWWKKRRQIMIIKTKTVQVNKAA